MRQPRGQTMLLLVLTMLLLTVMVCMTLSFGTKVKEKMETQAVADAAAYTNAVITARAFNGISLMNRVAVSHMVSMAATQAAISFSGSYRGYLGHIHDKYTEVMALYGAIAVVCCACPGPTCNPACCNCAVNAVKWSKKNRDKAKNSDDFMEKGIWAQLDKAAGKEAETFQGSVNSLHSSQLLLAGELVANLTANLRDQQLLKGVKKGSAYPGEWDAPGFGWNNLREIGFLDLITFPSEHHPWPALPISGPLGTVVSGGAINSTRPADHKGHHVSATMGSRGNPFVTIRAGASLFIETELNNQGSPKGGLYTPDNAVIVNHIGATNFHTDESQNGGEDTNHETATANDEGQILINWQKDLVTQGLCIMPPPTLAVVGEVKGRVISADLATTDQHDWSPAIGKKCTADNKPADYHTMGACSGNCPGMWPMFSDYNYWNVMDPLDNYGQPHLLGVIQRDYGARNSMPGYSGANQADPWNLLFRFRFTPGGKEQFDNRGIKLLTSGTDISKQTAISTAVAYYHRWSPLLGGWGEPPNFMNPWWRATLVGGEPKANFLSAGQLPDFQWDPDMQYEMGAAAPFAKDAYLNLKSVGFKGWL